MQTKKKKPTPDEIRKARAQLEATVVGLSRAQIEASKQRLKSKVEWPEDWPADEGWPGERK